MSQLAISVTDRPNDSDIAVIHEGIAAFNTAEVGPSDMVPVAVFVRDADGALIAGLDGNTGWGWLYVQSVWVAEHHRGQGLAGRLLSAAEDEARRRGCHSAYLDTFNPVALKTYERAGYTAFGALEHFAMGRPRTFLRKTL